MVKLLKNLLLRNQKADDIETWYAALGAGEVHLLNHEKMCIKSEVEEIFWNLQ